MKLRRQLMRYLWRIMQQIGAMGYIQDSGVDGYKLTDRVLDKSVGRSLVEEIFELIDLSDY